MASKKKSASKLALAVGQAKVQASDLQDRIGPAVEDARERLAPVVADARERITPVVEDARIRLTPVVEDARGRLTPVVEDARDRLTPVVGDAKERLADLAGTVAVKLDESLPDKATPAVVAAAAKRSKGSGRLKKLFVVAGIGAAAAVIAQKLRSNGAEPQWQSTPPGRPTPAPAPSTTEQAAETAAAPAAACGESPLVDTGVGRVSGRACCEAPPNRMPHPTAPPRRATRQRRNLQRRVSGKPGSGGGASAGNSAACTLRSTPAGEWRRGTPLRDCRGARQPVEQGHWLGRHARGHHGAKRLKGRKRHFLVDTTGSVLLAAVHTAALHSTAQPARANSPRITIWWT